MIECVTSNGSELCGSGNVAIADVLAGDSGSLASASASAGCSLIVGLLENDAEELMRDPRSPLSQLKLNIPRPDCEELACTSEPPESGSASAATPFNAKSLDSNVAEELTRDPRSPRSQLNSRGREDDELACA